MFMRERALLSMPSSDGRPSVVNRLHCIAAVVLVLSFIGGVGCSSSPPPPKKRIVRHDWFYPTRQHAPEEIYSRVREVRPPEPVTEPPRDIARAPRLMPVMQFNVSQKSLVEVAQLLAESYRYGFYCSPIVADRQISLRAIGTLDELAAQVAELGQVKVTVDHENRELRILSGAFVSQELGSVERPVEVNGSNYPEKEQSDAAPEGSR
jgi:hypothetical protein